MCWLRLDDPLDEDTTDSCESDLLGAQGNTNDMVFLDMFLVAMVRSG